MWLLNKNSNRHCSFALSVLLVGFLETAYGEIVIDYSSVSPPAGGPVRRMPGIVVYPGYPQTETGYQIQRSHAWRLNRQGDPRSGSLLVYPPMAGAVGMPGSQRQQDVRTNLSRAHAYRLDYYKR
ncbi:hypothetical protein VX159_00305 [Dechloromonas sp. ZY10]|uniref:hypothetical protein n=1 Tax=Dechloromonas aquae TaxID=2664436 RepID=UPI003527E99A